MTVPVSTRRYTSCCPPYPRGYISCVLLGGGRIKLIYKIHIILLLVRYCLRFFKLLCLFLQKDSIRWVYLVKVVRENSSFWCLFFKLCCCCLVAQSCPTLCGPMDCSPPGSSVHGILQARRLEWVAISFSKGSSRPRDWTRASHTTDWFFTVWTKMVMFKKTKKQNKTKITSAGEDAEKKESLHTRGRNVNYCNPCGKQ